MKRFSFGVIMALAALSAATAQPALAQDSDTTLNYSNAARCGVLNIFMQMLLEDGNMVGPFAMPTGDRDVPTYRLGLIQRTFYPVLRAGHEARIFILGEERYSFSLDDAPGLWEEMDECIAQYPNG